MYILIAELILNSNSGRYVPIADIRRRRGDLRAGGSTIFGPVVPHTEAADEATAIPVGMGRHPPPSLITSSWRLKKIGVFFNRG